MSTTGGPESSRKRAVIACNYCRKRKRRCDGLSPVCTLCKDSARNCVYSDVEPRREENDNDPVQAITDRLEAAEALLQEQVRTIATLVPHIQSLLHNKNQQSLADSPSQVATAPPAVTAEPVHTQIPVDEIELSPLSNSDEHGSLISFPLQDLPALTIPIRHSTTTGALLMHEKVQALLGTFPVDIFSRIEARRHVPGPLSMQQLNTPGHEFPIVDSCITNVLMEQFLAYVQPQYPLIESEKLMTIYHNVLREGPQDSLETALCFVVFALAEVASASLDVRRLDSDECPGLQYFSPALQVFMNHYNGSFGTSLLLPQGLYLCAIFYGFLARPLQSWRLVHMASTNLQHLWIQQMGPFNHPNDLSQTLIKTCWAIFVLECDLLAEHHLPRSGIEQIVDDIPLPLCENPPNPVLLYWLAEISARRLLNRIHHAMYDERRKPAYREHHQALRSASHNESSFESISSVMKISVELSSQLDAWYDLLPLNIKPRLGDISEDRLGSTIILLRYYSTREIIFRPCLLYVSALPSGTLPDLLADYCQRCLESCRCYLKIVSKRLQKPSASTEIIIHSAFAVTVILTLASLSPCLAHLVTDIRAIQTETMTMIRRWAVPGSCVESMLLILSALKDKTNMLINSSEIT